MSKREIPGCQPSHAAARCRVFGRLPPSVSSQRKILGRRPPGVSSQRKILGRRPLRTFVRRRPLPAAVEKRRNPQIRCRHLCSRFLQLFIDIRLDPRHREHRAFHKFRQPLIHFAAVDRSLYIQKSFFRKRADLRLRSFDQLSVEQRNLGSGPHVNAQRILLLPYGGIEARLIVPLGASHRNPLIRSQNKPGSSHLRIIRRCHTCSLHGFHSKTPLLQAKTTQTGRNGRTHHRFLCITQPHGYIVPDIGKTHRLRRNLPRLLQSKMRHAPVTGIHLTACHTGQIRRVSLFSEGPIP